MFGTILSRLAPRNAQEVGACKEMGSVISYIIFIILSGLSFQMLIKTLPLSKIARQKPEHY